MPPSHEQRHPLKRRLAYVLGFLEILLAGSLPPGMTAYRDAIIFVLLIVVLLVRPQGILGSGEREGV